MKKYQDVSSYVENAPKDTQQKLIQIRKLIKTLAPEAKESISYGMPYYSYFGRLAYFAYFKKHISIFVMPPVIKELTKDLKKFQTTKSSVHFPQNVKLPLPLIKKLIKASIRRNKDLINN